MKITALLMSCSVLTLALVRNAHAAADGKDDALPPIVSTESVVGEINWNSLKNKLTELLFNATQDISVNVLNTKGIKLNLQEGRVLLDSGFNRYSLVDHIGTTLSYGRSDNALSIGGQAGFSILFIRPIPTPGASLGIPALVEVPPKPDAKNGLADADLAANYNEDLEPVYSAMHDEIASGKSDLGKQMFNQDLPIQKYLDLLAAFKLPSRMPWNSKDVLNPKKFQAGDIASYNVNGGIWINLGAEISNAWASADASIGAFLRGNFRITLLREEGTKVLMEVVFEKDEGLQYTPLEIKLGVTFGNGIAIIKGKHISFTPLRITGQNYRSSIFSEAYQIDLANPAARKAFDAAIHGNLMRLETAAGAMDPTMVDVSKSTLQGHYDNSQVRVDLGLIKIEADTTHTIEQLDFKDERGTFERHFASFSSIVDTDATLWKEKRQQTQSAQATNFSLSPDGTYAPQFSWLLEDVNFYSDKNTYHDFLRRAENAIGTSPWPASYSNRKPSGLQHLAVHFDFSSKIYPILASLSEAQIWAAFETLGGVKPGTWSTYNRRDDWNQNYGLNVTNVPALNGDPYTGEEMLSLFEDITAQLLTLKKQSPTEQAKTLVSIDGATGSLPLLPRLLVELCGSDNALIRFENEGNDLVNPVVYIVNPNAAEEINYPSPYDWMTLPFYGLE